MRIKKLGIILTISVSLLLEGCLYINYQLGRSVDHPEGTISLKGLKEEAVIRRDDLGIPLVEAKNEDDLFFATGYAMASDRLWQMTVMKMAAQGRLAEMMGAKALNIDVLMRTLGIKLYAERSFASLPEKEKNLLVRFAAGVNAYLTTHQHLPVEFGLTGYTPGTWQPQDSLYIYSLLNLSLASNWTEELAFLVFAEKFGLEKAAYLFPSWPGDELPFQEAEKLSGLKLSGLGSEVKLPALAHQRIEKLTGIGGPASNNWALAGSRTKSGKSIVANDTHLHLSIPSIWMIMHLKCPTYEAAGVLVPGTPLVTLGYNGRIAWGATMVMADSQDIFLEKIEVREGKTCYVYQDQCLPLEEREETFAIKGKDPATRKIEFTRHGPLLNDALKALAAEADALAAPPPFKSPYGIAYRWSMADGERGVSGFYQLAKATTMQEARQSISLMDSIYLNIIYGDASSIAWQVTGRFPLRKKGTGQLPSPGWTDDYDWDGYLPFEKQPYSLNPPEGFLATANNKTSGPDSPHPLSTSWYGPERVERIRMLLSGMRDATFDDMMKMHADRYSLMAVKTKKLLLEGEFAKQVRKVIAGWPDKTRRRQALAALEMLGEFDCVITPESASAALMGAFHHSFTRNTFLDELGPENSLTWNIFINLNFGSYAAPEDHLLVRKESPYFDNIKTPSVETKADIMAQSLADAYTLCQKKMGKNPTAWQWGRLHTYNWIHNLAAAVPVLGTFFNLNRGPFPAGGDMQTLNVAGYCWGKNFDVRLIPAMRLLVDFGLDDPAFLITHGGQSGDPASPHYDDMIQPWIAVQSNPLPFREDNILRQYKNVLILTPQ